jgi:1,4-dihydroxy-2-naphthoate octaprenyltransferase
MIEVVKFVLMKSKIKKTVFKNTVQLLRIPFSLLLMPLFILALSQTAINGYTAIVSFIIIHLLVYPASNGYNSYIDKDESSIGGIEKPPLPTIHLFYVTIVLDFLAVILAFLLVNILFSCCILVYILASRAYSSKQIRLKKYPIIGFLIVVIFQGGFTYMMSVIGITNESFAFSSANILLLFACSFQIAGAYPLTQIYQHEADLADGVKTLSYQLGYKGTFIFTAIMFGLCNVFYYLYFEQIGKSNNFYLIQLFFIPIVIYFVWWFFKTINNENEANFKNTMQMNLIAAICMNTCFIILYLTNRLF